MRTLPLRTTLGVTAVSCLVVLYLLWWTTYTDIHFHERFTQLPPGAAGKVGGTTIRLLSMTRSDLLADQKFGRPPEQAEAGTTWVVAQLEAVQQPGAPAFSCTLELVGPEGRLWDKKLQTARTAPDCNSEEFTAGRPVRFETVFPVPDRFADQIAGVALPDPSVAGRVPVIAPPQ